LTTFYNSLVAYLLGPPCKYMDLYRCIL